ncbi:MAG TPA: hypothetical protein VGQ59_13080 [Cyclobacteriaceae bacterium]|jgi:hypothetical protein|nr:hypothetical protein [Cyclobacteriaceae bacterium]
MKKERSILIFASISLLTLAIFTSYHTPAVDHSSETDYLIDIENYKREVADRISIDSRRMTELNTRFEIKKSADEKDDEDELAMLKEKINVLKATMNNYEGVELEEWELFKKKFEYELTKLHESLINLIIKTSYSINKGNSIQGLVEP